MRNSREVDFLEVVVSGVDSRVVLEDVSRLILRSRAARCLAAVAVLAAVSL